MPKAYRLGPQPNLLTSTFLLENMVRNKINYC